MAVIIRLCKAGGVSIKILFAAIALQDKNGGVDKKIAGQVKALRRLGHETELLVYRDGAFFVHDGKREHFLFSSGKNAAAVYLRFQKAIRSVSRRGFDLCYIRHIFCSPFHLKTLRILKQRNIFCVEELPSYPYDKEFQTQKNPLYRLAALADRVSRKKYRGVLDLFVTFSGDSEIFGVPAVHIQNGVDFDSLEFIARKPSADGTVHLIAVSSMAPWHGYDRLIEGLRLYGESGQASRRVETWIVGDGACRREWEALGKSCGLSDVLHFTGQQTGEDLNAVFRRADIGIGKLGWYRIGVTESNELKTREYMARGLPFVYSADEALFSEQDGFCLFVPDNDTPLDIGRVLEFYARLRNMPDVSERLHEFAAKHFGWIKWMQTVLDAALSQREET